MSASRTIKARPTYSERLSLGIALAGTVCVGLLCLALSASSASPVRHRQCCLGAPAPTAAVTPEALEDPVQQGRGGRTPQLLDDIAEPPVDCAGTSISFVDGLPEAARQAKERQKLLMVLNVSGDFEDSRFT
jgi:hypothetical protein